MAHSKPDYVVLGSGQQLVKPQLSIKLISKARAYKSKQATREKKKKEKKESERDKADKKGQKEEELCFVVTGLATRRTKTNSFSVGKYNTNCFRN